MTGTLKARVSSAWVPILGSGNDAANVARWNSAWGAVIAPVKVTTSQTVGGTATDLTGATVSPTLVAGRRYEIRLVVPVYSPSAGNGVSQVQITDAANNILQATNRVAGQGFHGNSVVIYTYDAVSSGAVTFKGRALNNSGSTDFYSSSVQPLIMSVTDIGPVTPASIAPPAAAPRVVASGNALGVIAISQVYGASTFNGSTVVQITPTMTVALNVGRRYRIMALIRALTVGQADFGVFDNGAQVSSWMDQWMTANANYASGPLMTYIDGDGATHALDIRCISGTVGTVAYGGNGCYFTIEDVGPNTYPALPLPATFPTYTPVAYGNGWKDLGSGYQTAGYRKIGDIVNLRGYSDGTSATAVQMFTLPAGFRPPLNLEVPCSGYIRSSGQRGVASVVIRSDGVVQADNTTTNIGYLHSFSTTA